MEADEEVVAVHTHLQTFVEQYPELVKQLFKLHELDRLLLVKLFTSSSFQSPFVIFPPMFNHCTIYPLSTLNTCHWNLTFRAI